MKTSNALFLTLIALFFTGCIRLADPAPTNIDVPSGENLYVEANWWEEYNDNLLNSFVQKALENNKNLQTAVANVALANSKLRYAVAQRFPNLALSGGGTRQKEPDQTGGAEYNTFSLSGALSYEIDIWGKMQQSSESARNLMLQARANQESIKLSLIASVVDGYFAIVSLNEQKTIAQETLKVRQDSYALMQEQGKYGLVSEYNILQSEALVASAKMALENVDNSLVSQISSFEILIGTTPTELYERKLSINENLLPQPLNVPEGIPSTLIEKRPDIQAALYALYASNANINVAKAAYFPTISLSGILGLQSTEFRNLMRNSAGMWSVGGTIAMPLLDFGRTSSLVEESEASQEVARLNYETTVYQAFNDVNSAFLSRETLKSIEKQYEVQVGIYQRLADLSKLRYEQGLDSFLNVLDANESLLSAQLSLVQAKQSVLSNDVMLIKSLGGGWQGIEEFKEKEEKIDEEITP